MRTCKGSRATEAARSADRRPVAALHAHHTRCPAAVDPDDPVRWLSDQELKEQWNQDFDKLRKDMQAGSYKRMNDSDRHFVELQRRVDDLLAAERAAEANT